MKQGLHLFSPNAEKAWCEKFYIVYSCIWPIGFACWAISGIHAQFGDRMNIFVAFSSGLPNVIIPYYFSNWRKYHSSLLDTFFVKFNIWVFIFAFSMNYFCTAYFFDVLGMVYNYPHLEINLRILLVGISRQNVPLIMYFWSWTFFITYHTLGNIIIRFCISLTNKCCGNLAKVSSYDCGNTTSNPSRDSGGKKSGDSGDSVTTGIGMIVGTIIASYICAYGEIFGTTIEAIKDQFYYTSLEWALEYGSILYSIYFLVSFPMIFSMNENNQDRENVKSVEKWNLKYCLLTVFAATAIVIYIFDFVVQFVIVDWQQQHQS